MTNTSSLNSNLDALLALISSSARQAAAEYQKTGHGLPSLDGPHPFDAAADTLALKEAVRVLEGACEQLCSTLAQPVHTIINRGQGTFEPACIRVAAETRVADYIAEKPEGVHVDVLSKKTGIESGKLARILRVLATRNCFREVAPKVFANNRLSLLLQSSNPVSATLGHHTDDSKTSAAYLLETLTDPEYADSYDSSRSAFMYAVQKQDPSNKTTNLFEWFTEHPKYNERFDRAMVGWNELTSFQTVLDHYPWKDLPKGTTVCDVGGGIGGFAIQLARAYPHLDIVLQDLPKTMELGKTFWDREYPEAVEQDRIKFIPIDFFREQPAKGDVYYLRHVIHDWSDDEALSILRNVRKAMSPGSRLLIQDYVLPRLAPSYNADGKPVREAPEPLLPNYGSGSTRIYVQDINMLGLMNAKERMADEFAALGAEVGLELVKVWDFIETGILELRVQ